MNLQPIKSRRRYCVVNVTNMESIRIEYRFKATLWQYAGPAGWHFVSLPQKLSKEIRRSLRQEEAGWGRLPVTAKTGTSEWKTAIWFDTKLNTYLLPLKAEIRKKERLLPDTPVRVIIYT